MPQRDDAAIEISAFKWVPPFAQGKVRDIRIRWALEELGLPYRVKLFDARVGRPAEYFQEQPFGQVPAFTEGAVQMFESGAILLYLAERGEVLMPRDTVGRTRTMCWVAAALNSVEPLTFELVNIDLFNKGEQWATLRRPEAEVNMRKRLTLLSGWLGDKPYLEGDFTVADLLMTTVLRNLDLTRLVEEHANLAAYMKRCMARPAFAAAIAAQMDDFVDQAA